MEESKKKNKIIDIIVKVIIAVVSCLAGIFAEAEAHVFNLLIS